MADEPVRKDSHFERMQKSLLRNPTSRIGIAISVVALFLSVFFLILDFLGGATNPYTGILTFFVFPGILFAGIVITIVGAILERRNRRLRQPAAVPRFPVVDLNDPSRRRHFIWVAAFFILFFLLSSVGGYRAYHFSDSVTFCGKACHEVMEPEFTTYSNSPHARVACVACHIGPGADWFVRSKLSGMYQVYATTFDKYPRPIPTPIENLRPAQETCEQCHWPKQFFGAVQKENRHYLMDEENTPWTIQLLIKVGGGDPTFGKVGGIHWHMSIENKIEYVATDDQRQNIAWVRKTDENGTVTIYESVEEPLENPPEAYEIRTMDCIDCHNRPTHIFRSPREAINVALQTRRIDRDLPYVKMKGVELLAEQYGSTDEARRAIADGLNAFYKAEYPQIYEQKKAAIGDAVEELSRIYRNNFFPAMNSRWDIYPDNVGHLIWKGCFRCHNGNHLSEAEQSISKDCNACHIIISQGTEEETAVSLAGLEFRHPVDIGEAWREMACHECHTGAI